MQKSLFIIIFERFFRKVSLALALTITSSFWSVSGLAGPPVETGSFSFDRQESVLERFRSFTGEKSRENLENLFRSTNGSFFQKPTIILSDGAATVRVTVRVFTQKDSSPRFLVSSGKCLDVRKKDKSTWILDIVPDRGSTASSVTVLSEKRMVEYPLVVAPPLNLFVKENAEPALIEYVTIANEMVTSPENPVNE